MSKAPLISVELKTPETAEGAAAGILAGARDQLGFVPNMYAAMANMPAVLEHYTASYSVFRAAAGFSPAEQETVILGIACKTFSNYINHLVGTEVDAAMAAYALSSNALTESTA
ncbi:MAG: hypothetical protein AAF222_16105 [Pseudomonadota bacterium]